MLQGTIQTLVWLRCPRFGLHQYAMIAPRYNIQDLFPMSRHMLQMPARHTRVPLMHQYAMTTPRNNIQNLFPISHHMLQMSTKHTQIRLMHKHIAHQAM